MSIKLSRGGETHDDGPPSGNPWISSVRKDSPKGIPQGDSPRVDPPGSEIPRQIPRGIPQGIPEGDAPRGPPKGFSKGTYRINSPTGSVGVPGGPLGGLLEPPALSSMNVAKKMDR